MKFRSLKLAVAALIGTGAVHASDIVSVDQTVPLAGGTVMVPISLEQNGDDLSALNFNVMLGAGLTYDSPPAPPACVGNTVNPAGAACSYDLPMAGQANYGNSNLSAFADGQLFLLPIAVPGGGTDGMMISSAINVTACNSAAGCSVNGGAAGATAAGTFNITYVSGSSLDVAPASAMVTAAVNGPAATSDFTFTAMSGTVTGISCSGAGGNPAQITFATGGVPASLTSPNTFTVTGSCQGAAPAMGLSGTVDCDYTDSNSAAQTVSATLNCDVEAGIPVAGFSPPNGGTLTVGPVAPGGTFTSNVVFREVTNGGMGYTVDSCSLDVGTAASFSLDGATSGSVPSGGSFNIPVTVTGASPADTGGITCTYTLDGNTLTYTASLAVLIQATQVPTLSQWAMILMALALVGFGAFRLRKGGMAA